MKKLVISMSLGLVALVLASPAFAQSNTGGGSYIVDKKKLDKVKPYNAPRQFDLLDERPILHNHLTADEQPDVYEINAGFPAARPGRRFVIGSPNSGDAGASPFRTSNPNLNSLSGLAPAADMHRSNISSKPPVNTGALPDGQSTGVHGPTGEAAMGKRVSASLNTPVPIVAASAIPVIAKVYKNYSQDGTSAGRLEGTGTVSGRLAPGTWATNRLLKK